ncbi:MAG: hypothetical protein K0S76_1622 [Herbinix sp.]|jgi:ABC-type multidrug transport system ATPase subunit/pSer/pThr/pTyr-binding forkhead associated (FHA) protein|nr:hypothetical protein [Herbinix sp.]
MDEKTTFYREDSTKPSGSTMIITIFDGLSEPKRMDLKDFGKEKITFGRNHTNDIVLTSSIVSGNHGYFLIKGGKCSIIDDHSTNGLYYLEKPIENHTFSDGDVVKIDDVQNPIKKSVSFMFSTTELVSEWSTYELNQQATITIGRDDQCDICLKHVSVSKIHAKIMKEGDAYYLYDNDSTNGVSVNGKLITGKYRLQEKDLIIITNSKLIFTTKRISYICYNGGISVDAIDIVKTVKSKKKSFHITNHISLSIKPSEFVAIIGGSGAGKTTFMNCISGYNRATSGQVLVNGEDLYGNYEVLKSIIGYVPQQDIVYDNLTLRNMLSYTAMLRMPKDTSASEREKRVQEVIDMVELTGREETFIKELSGGQKKRASIAVELLSDPKLFFLDEPSSGLDPGTERNLMRTLQHMTAGSKTIILVTHNTLNLHLCDKVIFLGKGGNLCFCGSPSDALTFFGVDNFVDIYNMVTSESEKWRDKFLTSKYYVKPQESDKKKVSVKDKKNKKSTLKQTVILSKRYVKLLLNDKQRMLLLLLQAPLLAVLIYLVANGKQFDEYEMTKSILFALSCCAFWIGILNSIQEVCKERVILKREHLTGLKLTAYVNSKFVVLGALCLIQSLLLIGVFSLLIGVPEEGVYLPAFVEMYITTFLTAFSATGMGLFVSSLFINADRAMTVAPVLLMPQILFSGLVFKLSGVSEKISYAVNCRWTMEGYGTTSNLNSLTLRMQEQIPTLVHEAEDFFEFTVEHLLISWGFLLGFTILFGILSLIGLRNVDK